jgi:restriction endonuclease Mrr
MEGQDGLVLVVTKETKGDWWVLEEKRPRGPRPELIQELRDSTGADLLLLSLNEFMEGVRKHLSFQVPDQTLHELREVSEDLDALLPDAFRSPAAEPNLLSLPPREFERLVHYLLIRLGYDVDTLALPFVADFFLLDRREGKTQAVIAEAKRWRGPVGSDAVLQLRGALDVTGAQSALLITTGAFTAAAREAAQNAPIELIDGVELVQLLATVGIRATIQFDADEGAPGA